LLGLVGLPFFVVATSAPLLQKWFAGTTHPAAGDPYFLYGASNLGSMLSLLAYPVMVEPLLGLEAQSWLWMIGYGTLVLLVLLCGVAIWNSPIASAHAGTPLSSLAPAPVSTAVAVTVDRRSGRQRVIPKSS